MEIAFEWRPDLPPGQPPPQLLLLLHDAGQRGAAMAPLADALHEAFPHAAIVAPEAPHGVDEPGGEPGGDPGGDRTGRRWFAPAAGDDEAGLADRVAAALPALVDWVRATQRRTGAGAAATAIAGFGQGALMALELAAAHDGLCGRVLAFGGRFARLPDQAPRETTLHLFHGGADADVPPAHARAALDRLGALDGDATLDVAEGVGHRLHPALIDQALFRLRNHIPHRTWRAALGAAPVHRRDVSDSEDAPGAEDASGRDGPAPC